MSQSTNSTVEAKLAALRAAYLNELPKKFSEIEHLWLMMSGPNWQGIHAQDLHRHLHSLAGSGTTFGAPEISQIARQMEQRLRLIISENRNATAEEREEITEGLRDLDRAIADTIKAEPAEQGNKRQTPETEPVNTKLIYLLADDEGTASRYETELGRSGFVLETFSSSENFLVRLRQQLPRAVIIDITSPEKSFRELQQLQEVLAEAQQPPYILYASIRNDIETRLAALKIGAERFFTKPVNFIKLTETLFGLTQEGPHESYRVLIVDDAETLSEFYATTLENAGIETHVINNPLFALTELEKFSPDLMLMDVYMPECSGLELAAVIRQDDNYAQMPIVFLSTETDLDKQMAAMNLGGDEFLTKPIEPEHLVAAIMARVKRSRWLNRLRNELQSALHENERQKIDIQRKEERLKRSQRYANIGTWDWHIKTGDIYWSDRVMALYGYEAGEVTTSYEEFINKVHPDDKQKLIAAIKGCLDSQQEYEVEHRVLWPDQSVHWLLERGDVQRDATGEASHMLAVVQDITNRKTLEHALSEQKSLLSMLQYGLSQYVSSRAIRDTSRYLLDGLLAITQSEYGFIGEVLHDDKDQAYLETHVLSNAPGSNQVSTYFESFKDQRMVITNLDNVFGRVVETGQPLVLDRQGMQDYQRSFPDGHPIPQTFAGVPIYFGDELVGIYGLANRKSGYDDRILDFLRPFNTTYGVIINARRLMQQEQLIKADLETAKEEADRANHAKSDFLNHMSHELRTPMNAILGFSQLMEADDEEPLSKTHKDYIHEITKAGRHLLDLIDEVLDLARIEAGKLKLAIEPVSLADVVSECRALIEPLAASRQLELKFCERPCFDVWVQVDRMRLKQILLNLLSNAIKYNRDNGEISLGCEAAKEGLVRLSVCDTGEGIAAEKLDKLFVAFDRLGVENSNVEGTGIGLMISRHMIELMEGHMEVTSTLGEGSCFAFTIPLSRQ